MAKKEKFGKFVLLEEVERSGIGSEYRAAKLSATGLEKIVSVVRLDPALAANADAAKNLMDQVKFAAQLQNPNILKIYGIGKVDAAYYISYEFLEGKSLKAVFARCRQEGFPLSVDHALLISSKICSALEFAHGRKAEQGGRYLHGQLTPANVLVSYEGEVRVRGFGYWPSGMREAGLKNEDDGLYLAPEQVAGHAADHRSDVFALGAILFETLTGQPLFQGGRTDDIAGRLAQARLQSPSGDDDSLPAPIRGILERSLALDPAQRFQEIQEVRKAIDTLLFSGDFTPTTFNLAFFMHSLFREDIDREGKALKEEREANYVEFLGDEKAPARTGAPVAAAAAAPAGAPRAAAEPPPAPSSPHTVPVSHPPFAPAAPAHTEPVLTARDAHAAPPAAEARSGSKTPLIAGAAAVLVIGGIAAALLMRKGEAPAPAAPPPTAANAAADASAARLRELEEKLRQLEAEKAAAVTKAEEEAKKKLEEKARAAGQAVDPAAVAKAQEEARKKAQAEQERKLEEEKKRVEQEKKAEEERLAEERRREEEARKTAAATQTAPPPAGGGAAPPPTSTAANNPPPPGGTVGGGVGPLATTAPAAPAPAALKPGALVNLNDVGVIPPTVDRQAPLTYPPVALRQKVEGVVELNVLVDEKGSVVDAQVVSGVAGRAGLNEAAVDNVKKRRYRAAMKDGVPVKVWIPVKVNFVLPK